MSDLGVRSPFNDIRLEALHVQGSRVGEVGSFVFALILWCPLSTHNMPSSSSGSSSESSSSPAPTRKKRQAEAESSDSSDDHDTSDDEEDSDAPQPLPEVTVLSHAERRRQKKKQKQQLATESPRKKRKLDDGTGTPPPSNVSANPNAKTTTKTKASPDDPRRQKHQNSIWVGNLSFRTTQDALRGFFDGVGTITRVHMPMRRGMQIQGENMGCVLSSPPLSPFPPAFYRPFCVRAGGYIICAYGMESVV